MPKTRIYTLSDPISNTVMYVGKTIDTLKRRLNMHIHCAKHNNTPRDIWIAGLLNVSKRPIILLIEDVEEIVWKEREIYWISYYRNVNPNLTNISKGGHGPSGTKRSEENLRSLSVIKSKPIYQLDKNLSIVNEFPSCKIAQIKTGICGISKVALNNTKRTAKGYIWVYKSDYPSFMKSEKRTNFIKDKPHLCKKISIYNKEGELLRRWNSVKQASLDTGFRYRGICKAAGGFRKSYKKFIWKYEN